MKEGEFVYDGSLGNIQRMLGDEKVVSVTTQEETFKVQVPRKDLSTKTHELFEKHEVIDLNIQDPSIEEVIESIMRSGVGIS